MKYILILLIAFVFVSCRSESDTVLSEDQRDFAAIGDSLTSISQQVLLSNVANAMQNGGPTNAIDYCHVNASTLIDSLSRANDVMISRISLKNRNEDNAPTNEEKMILKELDNSNLPSKLVSDGQQTIYYKPIRIGMTTCLKCHGELDKDIDQATLEIIQKHYPEDKAQGYQLNDFRGAWKVVFLR